MCGGVDELRGGLRRMDGVEDGTGLRGITVGVGAKTFG